ncbi:peptidoglycan-associated lipoprotein Pal [Desulfurispira natronophila]|uniref:Peptidoglycan-associated lipoprotein n=1 Tax=Desulfurispira natronophila TaxID=682562 RepID=A0A7W7Y5P9_9BACT|nr:peptidoglycan-associated lipoprotein Pal [Desulfurispira natronophila]MBB5022571.1 peptidoglycan-associated lipoprotein [Desulfurispira natronophila]
MTKFKGMFAILAGLIILVAVGCGPQQVAVDEPMVDEPAVSAEEERERDRYADDPYADDPYADDPYTVEDRERYAFNSPVLNRIYLDGSQMYTVHFDFDRSSIRSDARKILDNNVTFMERNPEVKIVIEGHCDERGSSDYNLALGDRRAQSVKDYLVTNGIDASRITTISYGKEKPADPRSNESAWQKNRRGEFVKKQ